AALMSPGASVRSTETRPVPASSFEHAVKDSDDTTAKVANPTMRRTIVTSPTPLISTEGPAHPALQPSGYGRGSTRSRHTPHVQPSLASDAWIPAFAGMTDRFRHPREIGDPCQ